jgi:hypothetical protein
MDLESVADELYSASPDEFVERRKERVAEARSVKDRELVKAIGQLRRPTRSAWLVNLLSREAGEDVADLLELGTALAQAQQRGSGPDLRRLSKQRHAALEALTRRAVELGAARGHTATEATRQEVSQTLQAALADPSVAELVRTGRVLQPASYGGFGPMDLFGGALTPSPDTGPPHPSSEDATGGDVPATATDTQTTPEPEDPARVAAEVALRDAHQAAAEAREQAATANREAEQATAEADDLADRVEELRTRLQEAEEEERRAREQARAARKEAQQRQQAVTGAEEALAEAQRALAQWETT